MPLIVLEGIDGCGKSTQIALLEARLASKGVVARRLREPGGTALGEQARRILLDPATTACPTAELFGYLLARAQLCEEVIRPALARGELVLLDRFYHSTLAYQAYGLGLDVDQVRAAIRLAVGGVAPDLVLWLDLPPELARQRATPRGSDRIEARGLEYMQRVHDGFRTLAAAGEMVAIDATREQAAIAEAIWRRVEPLAGG